MPVYIDHIIHMLKLVVVIKGIMKDVMIVDNDGSNIRRNINGR